MQIIFLEVILSHEGLAVKLAISFASHDKDSKSIKSNFNHYNTC